MSFWQNWAYFVRNDSQVCSVDRFHGIGFWRKFKCQSCAGAFLSISRLDGAGPDICRRRHGQHPIFCLCKKVTNIGCRESYIFSFLAALLVTHCVLYNNLKELVYIPKNLSNYLDQYSMYKKAVQRPNENSYWDSFSILQCFFYCEKIIYREE